MFFDFFKVICWKKSVSSKLASTIKNGIKYTVTNLFYEAKDTKLISDDFSLDLFDGKNLDNIAELMTESVFYFYNDSSAIRKIDEIIEIVEIDEKIRGKIIFQKELETGKSETSLATELRMTSFDGIDTFCGASNDTVCEPETSEALD